MRAFGTEALAFERPAGARRSPAQLTHSTRARPVVEIPSVCSRQVSGEAGWRGKPRVAIGARADQ
jgi:hypothetical protein